MPNECTISIAGHLGADPDPQYSKGGKAYCKFSVAVSSGKEDNRVTLWQRCVCFDRHAEDLGQLSKGDAVVIIGYLKPNDWVDQEGKKHSTTELMVRAIGKALGQRRGESSRKQDNRDRNQGNHASDNAGGYEPPPEDEIPF